MIVHWVQAGADDRVTCDDEALKFGHYMSYDSREVTCADCLALLPPQGRDPETIEAWLAL